MSKDQIEENELLIGEHLEEEKLIKKFANLFWKETFEEDFSEENEEPIKEQCIFLLEAIKDEMYEIMENWMIYHGIERNKKSCECGKEITNKDHKVCLDCWKQGKR